MDGLALSKEAVLSAMLEARHMLTDAAEKDLGDSPYLKGIFMTAIDFYEKSLIEYLRLGVN